MNLPEPVQSTVADPSQGRSGIVVYSCHFGQHEPFNPQATGEGPGYDRVVFTDLPGLQAPGVQVRFLRPEDLPGVTDGKRLSRLPKLCPHLFFPNHDWAIYVDNCADLRVPPSAIVQTIEELHGGHPPRGRYLFKHRTRDCAYREALVCKRVGKITRAGYRQQVRAYKNEGFPQHHGLYMNTMMIQRMGDEQTDRFNQAWFDHFMTTSQRDQISLPFMLWKTGCPATVLPLDLSAWAKWPKFRKGWRERFQRAAAEERDKGSGAVGSPDEDQGGAGLPV